MAWFRVDDGFPEHPKLEALEADPRRYMAAITVWTIMGADCARRLTDGFVSRARLEKVMFRLGKAALEGAAALVSCELWEVVDGGWQFHDWRDYQPTKGDVDAARKAKTERQRRWRGQTVDASAGERVDDAVDASTRPPPGSTRVDPIPSHPIPSHPKGGSGPPPEPPNPGRFRFELDELVRAEFSRRGSSSQKASDKQWRDGCQTVQEALDLGAYPDARAAMLAFAEALVDACAGGEKLGFALQQVQLGAQLRPPVAGGRQLSELAQRTLARRAEGT